MPDSQYKFGEFELDTASFELRRQGRTQKLERVPLERIPLELLILLAEGQGSVVTRGQIVDRLWGKDVFVDTDHGINTAIRKIRQALKDDPDHPRFVQTVTGKGYRFVAEKSETPQLSGAAAALPAAAQPMSEQPPPLSGPAQAISGGATRPSGGAELPGPIRSTTAARTPLSTKIKPAIALALTFALALALTFAFRSHLFPASRAHGIHSIAVLPLANLSGDASQDYFADGMTDEIITMLAKNTSLRVVSRTSAMQYKGVNRPLPEIARELGVDGILEGSIERSANRVHMTVQLIYAPTDTHVWAESYDRNLDQAFSLPSDLSQTIAKAVQVVTSPARPPRYINPEAHDAYLRGRYFWFAFKIPETQTYFEKAIHLQPDYAAAWSGLSDAYTVAGMIDRPPLEVMPKALEAARKAVELDDSLSEAHNSMAAWYLWYGWDVPRADAESKRAIELNPDYVETHQVRAWALLAMNREAEALAEEKRAVELDPFARPFVLGLFYLDIRQYDAAVNELRLQHIARPTDDAVVMYLSKAYWMKGMYKESQEALEEGLRLEDNSEAADAAHQAWIRGGEKAVEQWGAETIKARARKGYVYAFGIATALAFTGDKEQTLKYIEQAYREHDPDMMNVQYEPLFDFVHSDPRYQALVKKIGLQLVP